MPRIDDNPPVGEKGLVATENWADWELGPYNAFPSRKKAAYEYWLMEHRDATVRSALLVIRFIILANIGNYHHEDEAIQERADELLGKIAGGMTGVFRRLLSALWAGYAIVEKDWVTTADEWYIAECDLLHPLTFFAQNSDTEGIKIDAKAKRVTEVTQYAHTDQARFDERKDKVTLPIDRVIYWPMLQEAREETYGNSLLEGARRAWFSKVKEENYWNTFAEKCACPTPVFWVPQTSMADVDGTMKPVAEILPAFYEKLKPGQAMAIPTDMEMQYKMDVLSPTGDGEAFERVCRYWDSQLYKAILTPRLLMEEPEHASRAQAETNLDLFILMLDGIRSELGEVIVEQLVKPLLFYNVGELSDYGEWRFAPFKAEDLELLARIFSTVERGKADAIMSGSPLLKPDMDKLRETFSDVYASAEEVEEAEAERAAEEAAQAEEIPEELRFGEDEE